MKKLTRIFLVVLALGAFLFLEGILKWLIILGVILVFLFSGNFSKYKKQSYKNVGILLEDSVKEILNSPDYQALSDEKKKNLEAKLSKHFRHLLIVSFVNSLSSEKAKVLNNNKQFKENPDEIYIKINRKFNNNSNFNRYIKNRFKKETEEFKSVGSN